MWLNAPNIACVHGFSTRLGGVSAGPFGSLNLGGSEDDSANIARNREIALQELGLNTETLCTLKQVHGNHVCIARPGAQQGDALVSAEQGLTLAVSIADCYPILFHDPVNKVIGAAHAGWRGTQARIVENTLKAMQELGASPEHIRAAVGQGISQPHFEVGSEVIEKFREANFPGNCWHENRINLIKCNMFVLLENKIPERNIWAMNRCTFEKEFFSYRRDKGYTGRMWGLIHMN